MTRILFHTDDHLSRTGPGSRQDDFFETILGKDTWITDYGIKMGVDLYLHGGDLFEKSTQTVYELNRVYDAWERRKAPTWGIAGNHPIAGNAELWHERSGLLVLERQGLIEMKGVFQADIEVDGCPIRMVHGDLLRRPAIWDHILWKNYDPGKNRIVLCGHYHPKQGYMKIRNTFFAGPGAVSRGTLAEENLKRKPACTLITIEGKKISFKHVIIPHRPGHEVLDNNAVITIPEVQQDDLGLEECVDTIREMEEERGETLGWLDILKLVRQNMPVSDAAFELVASKLRENGSE